MAWGHCFKHFGCSGGGPRPPRSSGSVPPPPPQPSSHPVPVPNKPPRFCGRKAECLLLDGTRDCFGSCIRISRRFALIAGLQLNYDKSTAVWIGPLRNSRTKFVPKLNFIWNPATFKILGVIYTIFFTTIHEIVLLNDEINLYK